MRFENLKSFSSAAVGFDNVRSIYVACFVLAQRQVSSHIHRSATLIIHVIQISCYVSICSYYLFEC